MLMLTLRHGVKVSLLTFGVTADVRILRQREFKKIVTVPDSLPMNNGMGHTNAIVVPEWSVLAFPARYLQRKLVRD